MFNTIAQNGIDDQLYGANVEAMQGIGVTSMAEGFFQELGSEAFTEFIMPKYLSPLFSKADKTTSKGNEIEDDLNPNPDELTSIFYAPEKLAKAKLG